MKEWKGNSELAITYLSKKYKVKFTNQILQVITNKTTFLTNS